MPKIIILIFIAILLNSCSKPEWLKGTKQEREAPVNAKERARLNVKEGRGISLNKALRGGSGSNTFQFSSSNPLWRSSLEILDFLPLTTVDYSGGIIITDWYSDSTSNDAIKITVRFLSNEIRTDSIKIIVHSKNCKTNQTCKIVQSNSKIKTELQRSILTKAKIFEKELKDKK
jgi:hypothetical protein